MDLMGALFPALILPLISGLFALRAYHERRRAREAEDRAAAWEKIAGEFEARANQWQRIAERFEVVADQNLATANRSMEDCAAYRQMIEDRLS